MKKQLNVIALLLAIFMLIPTFAACGNQNENGSDVLSLTNSDPSENIGRFDYLVENGESEKSIEQLSTVTLLGDANGDALVDSKDVLYCALYLASKSPSTGDTEMTISAGANVNGDGKINVLDLIRIRQLVVSGNTGGERVDAEYASDFTVAQMFSDDMVVQRNEHIRVWGFAPESENGKKVSGEFKGIYTEALIENGEWCLTFGTKLAADTTPSEMKIYTDTKEVVFDDVLVGDVYLVMGQSNAAYAVSSHLAYTDPATQGGGVEAIDENSIIRLNYLNGGGGTYAEKGTDYVYKDLENTTLWTKTTVAQTERFSAIGYYFAREMVERSDNTVPVGLIEVAKGGAPLGSFLPNDLAELYGTDYFNASTGTYLTTRSDEHMGRYLYNCYLAPASRYAVAGIVWYQGESDNAGGFARAYGEQFNAFVERLRSTHNVVNKDFPVFVVEIPSQYQKPVDYEGSWTYMETGTIRSYMGLLPTTVDNCYLAASSDLWNDREFANNLHPNCKFEQAQRLASLAEVVIFGEGTLEEAGGPIFKSYELSEDGMTAVITFSNVGDGLTTADGGTDVIGVVGLLDKPYRTETVSPVSATITAKDQITVVFDAAVKAVAYNRDTQDYYGETINLCNSANIPALAFITPYEEEDLGVFESSEFVSESDETVGFKRKSLDSLMADGVKVFDSVAGGLLQNGNKVTLGEGTTRLTLAGWVGFEYEIILCGHSINGGNAVFDTYVSTPEAAVINAAGEYAKRFSISIDTSDLEKGEYTVDYLALVDVNGGVAVKLLSFTLNIVCNHEYDVENIKVNGDGTHSLTCLLCGEDKVEDCVVAEKVYNSEKEVYEDKCECGYVLFSTPLNLVFEGTAVMDNMVNVNVGITDCFQVVVSQVEATQEDIAHTHYIAKPGSYASTNADASYDGDSSSTSRKDQLYTGTDGEHGTPYFYLYQNANGDIETGRYIVIKYRVPAASVSNTEGMFYLYAATTKDSVSTTEHLKSQYFGTANGEWGVFVADLSGIGDSYSPADDGKYYAKAVRLCVRNTIYDGTFDIAYVGFCDSLSGIAAYINENAEGANTHDCFNISTQLENDVTVEDITYEKAKYHSAKCVICETSSYLAHSYTSYAQTDAGIEWSCDCGYSAIQAINKDAAKKYINPLSIYNNLTAWGTCDRSFAVDGGEAYFRLTGKGATLYHDLFKSNTEETGHILVIKYRTSATPGSGLMNIWSYTDGNTAGNGEKGKLTYSVVGDGAWHLAIVDLSTHANFNADDNGDYIAQFVRLDPWGHNSLASGATFDIAYVAMFDTYSALDSFLIGNATDAHEHIFNESAGLIPDNNGKHASICYVCGAVYENCTETVTVRNENSGEYDHSCVCGYVFYSTPLTLVFEGTEVMDHMVNVNKGTTDCFLLVVSQVEATQEDIAHTHYITKPGSYNSTNADASYDGDSSSTSRVDQLYTGTDSTHTSPYFTLYKNTNGDVETGRYMIIKYRVPAETIKSTTKTGVFSVWSSTEYTGATGSDTSLTKYTGTFGVANGEWGVFAVDLSKIKTYTPAEDGKYYAKFVRLDLKTTVYDGTFDIAYVGFCDSLADIAAYIDEDVEGANTHTCVYGDFKLDADVTVDSTTYKKAEYHAQTCVICEAKTYVAHSYTSTQTDAGLVWSCTCGSTTTQQIETSVPKKFISPLSIYTYITSWANTCDRSFIVDDGEAFFRLTGKGKTLYSGIYAGSADVETGHLFVIKYRTVKLSSDATMSVWSYTDSDGADGAKGNLGLRIIRDGEWHIAVLDLSAHANFNANDDGKYYARFLRIDPWGNGATITDGATFDIAYAAFVNSYDALNEFFIGSDPVYSDGFEYTLNAEKTAYSITKYIGNVTEVVILSEYNGKPITSIGDYAFYHCSALETVNYTGTEEQWNAISISSKGNNNLTNATVNYEFCVHTPGDEATCTEPQRCTKCQEVLVEALGHTEAVDEAVAPTCTETGLTAGTHCSVCGETLVAQETVSALGHTEVVDEAVAPTCSETGLTEGSHCSVCGGVLVAQETVATIAHTEVQHDAKAATETEIGWEAYVTCEKCDYTTYVEIPSILTLELTDDAYYSIVGCTQNVSSIAIPLTYKELPVARIAASAFANCTSLTTVNYEGVDEDWNNIVIEDGNENLTGATVFCNYGEISETEGVATVTTKEELTYTATNYSSIENGMFVINQGFEITFDDALLAAEFNRVKFKYKSTAPIKVTITYTLDGAEKTDYFYLEATKIEFRGLIEGYLADKKGASLKKLTIDTCEEIDAYFMLRDISTETLELYGELVNTTTTVDNDGDGSGDVEANRDLYIANDRYKIGIRLSWGGAMTYFEDLNDNDPDLGNLVNIHDTGRLIQQSFYGTHGNDEYTPGESNGTTWPYNPVQGGTKFNQGSDRLIDIEVGDDYIYILSQSLDWALDKNEFITHTYYENTYTLKSDHVVVDNVATDFSGWEHVAGGQEIPAVYLVSYFDTLSYYNGTQPWTNDESGVYYETELGGWSDAASIPLLRGNTETWSIWVNTTDSFGFGTYCPNIQKHIAMRHEYDGSTDPMANSTSYVAPSCSIVMQSYKPIVYSYILATGSPEEIREVFTTNKDFTDNASLSNDRNDQLVSPEKFDLESLDLTDEANLEAFCSPKNTSVSYSEEESAAMLSVTTASDPHVSLNYKWNSNSTISVANYNVIEFEYMIPTTNSKSYYTVQVFLSSDTNNSYSETYTVSGTLVADGNYHTAKLYVDETKWSGELKSIRFDYFRVPAEGDVIYLKSFVLKKYDTATIGVENDLSVNGNEILMFTNNQKTLVSFDETVGATKLMVTEDGADAYVGLDFSSLVLSADDYNTLVIEYMLPVTNSNNANSTFAYYKMNDATSYANYASVSSLTKDGEWHTMTISFADKEDWSGTIKSIRFDYFQNSNVTAGDTMYVKSIKWVKQ